MRLFIESINGTRIFKDRSPYCIPRWVVDDGNSIRIFSKLFYNLDKVRKCIDQEQQNVK
jgi:hypothetical protein